jgi:hypothetical protein
MRGLRGTSVAAIGLCVLLAAGGGYALASGGGTKTITVCVSHKGGTLYKAKKCAKHDKKLSWNKQGIPGIQGIQGQTGNTGPQGPGAKSLVYDAAGSATPPTTTVGAIGPWTLTAQCLKSGSMTSFSGSLSGSPGLQADGFGISGGSAFGESIAFPGPLSGFPIGSVSLTTSESVTTGQFALFPTTGAPLELLFTAEATGGGTNACHFSAVITPVAAPGTAAAAARGAKSAGWAGLMVRR